MSQHQQIIAKCKEVFAKANELYGLDFSAVGIHFDLKGRAAGMACRRPGGRYFMRFNHDMMNREAFDHVLNDTVPHEIAHIVCFMKPNLGRNHDGGWQRVCYQLGGSGRRCHKEEVVYAKGITFAYTSTTGHKCRVSETIHKRIQAGQSRSFAKRSLGALNNTCAYSIVGKQGYTLANPTPAKPVQPRAAPQVVVPTQRALPPVVTPVATPGFTHIFKSHLTPQQKVMMGWKPPVPSYNPAAITPPQIKRTFVGEDKGD